MFLVKVCNNGITKDALLKGEIMSNVDHIVSTEDSEILIEKDSKRITDDIVDKLIAYRKQLKLTQQDIADATGIKRANIARIELKKNEASLDSLLRYARSMKLDLSLELTSAQGNTVKENLHCESI